MFHPVPHRPSILHLPSSILILLLLLLSSVGSAVAAVHYVDASGANPRPPYTTWATAARVIKDAVDAELTGDEIVVTNGTYATGGRPVGSYVLINRVAVDKPLTLRSVNGPEVTVIQSYQVPGSLDGCGESTIRCVCLTNGASLSGFTLTNGATRYVKDYYGYTESSGGGVRCESSAVLSHCVLAGNSAQVDGGASGGTLNNCTLTGNSASCGGGAPPEVCVGFCYGALNNCIVYFNMATCGANYSGLCGNNQLSLNYRCSTPLPVADPWQMPFLGNITNAPLFVDDAAGNLRLQANFPCINAGENAYAPGTVDMDGQSRIVTGTVDIGAYEFQRPGSMISYAWLQQFGLPTDGSADAADPDADRHNTCKSGAAHRPHQRAFRLASGVGIMRRGERNVDVAERDRG